MRVYLDTSVLTVRLFGEFSDIDASRLPAVTRFFDFINSGKAQGTVSLYSLQEIYVFCKRTFPDDVGRIARVSLAALLKNEIEITGLLSR